MPVGVFVPAAAEDLSLSFAAGCDAAPQGSILYRTAGLLYQALPPGSNGQVLTSGGVAANPAWSSGGPVILSGAVILNPATPGRNLIQATATGIVPLQVKQFSGSFDFLFEALNPADNNDGYFRVKLKRGAVL